MKIERTANAKRNIAAGFAFKMVAMFGPFIMRTVLFYTLGVDYVGLNSLFTAILSFLALSELGIGSAMVYAMYKPIANDDTEAICALLNLYRKLYRIIGVVILVLGMILFPFIPHLVSGEVPADINLYVLYAFYLLNTVLSYFLYGYKQSLLLAHQRNDIISVRALIVRILMYTAQIVILFLTGNYYLYVLMFLAYTVITNIANSMIVDKLFPDYVCKGEVPKKDRELIKTNVLSLVGGKLSTIMLNFSDNLMISMFFGLAMVAQFDNYYYIVSMLVGFFAIVYEALTGGLGNSIQLDSLEKNHNDFKVLSFINFWLVSWSAICIMCIIQPFIHVWVGKDLMFSTGVAILFALYLYVMQSEKIVLTYKDAAGIWRQDWLRPYLSILINTVIDIVFVTYIQRCSKNGITEIAIPALGIPSIGIYEVGIYGVVLSTIVGLAVSVPWSARTLYKNLFKQSSKKYLLEYVGWFVKTALAGAATYFLCVQVPGKPWVQVAGRVAICAIVPNILLLLLNWKNPNKSMAFKRLKSAVLRKAR